MNLNRSKPLHSGFIVTFKHEHLLHDNENFFQVIWKGLYLLINLREMNASIVRSYAL
jgi:hypothetical protein